MKNLFKYFGVVAIAAIVGVNCYMSNSEYKHEFSLLQLFSSKEATAEFAFQPGKDTKNKSCVKEVTVGTESTGLKFGYRDKCKGSGSGCTPTTCQ